MTNEQKPTRGPYADIAPALDEIAQNVLFGDVWERPGFSKRDRSLITVATLVAQYRTNELPFQCWRYRGLPGCLYSDPPTANLSPRIAP